ncbi:uncharacterized protein SPAPADRAFT_51092 [Spathaspora passalidarum NRRL Y-27907]|uniref:F-box domain-containing protein n=1 Tax=Spathaspora passalidarum (strain NRRL Y-27907 / 11-Y1) TaxID=619300 RepID=G3ANL7_SPAPN|nr:uncharacterized protein SPAPADRAFT_51092 [Spathaspora passalidarum NRRL Y-27907]EGW32546.1 hypothetical protein SPAPADRAFT_51092 [Spathaspora passalidarum NRRL Y-27907]
MQLTISINLDIQPMRNIAELVSVAVGPTPSPPSCEDRSAHPDPLSVLSLPDELLSIILAHINQLDTCSVLATHSRFREVGQRKLFRYIYVTSHDTQLVVSSNFYTPFYTNFTVIGASAFDCIRFRPLDLVKKIVFDQHYGYTDWFKNTMKVYPHINFFVELPHYKEQLEYLQNNQIGRLRRFVLDQSIIFQDYQNENRLFVEELNVLKIPRCNPDLKVLQYLPNLRVLRIRDMLDVVHHAFRFGNWKKLHIEELSIFWKQDLLPEYITDLKYMFNLSSLESLELHFCMDNEVSPSYESDLQQMLTRTTNLTQLSLTCQHINFAEAIGMLKPNTLTSFHVGIVWERRFRLLGYEFDIRKVLNRQQESVERVSINDLIEKCECSSQLLEWDRFYKNVKACSTNDRYMYYKNKDEGAIRKVLQSGYLKLRQVVFDRRYYHISYAPHMNLKDIVRVL